MPDPSLVGIDGVQAKITLSLACNNDCKFCYNRVSKSKTRPIPEDRVFELIDEAAKTGATDLNFIGGEVTILPYFVDAVAHGSRKFPSISINSNGRRFADPVFARACIEAGLTAVDISLHGSEPSVHDSVTRAPGAFAEVVAGLENLLSLGAETGRPLLSVTTVILDWNLDDLGAIGSLLRRLGVSGWRLKYAFGISEQGDGHEPNDYVVPFSRSVPALRKLAEMHGSALHIALHDIPTCLLDELFELSTVHDRHSVARYTEQGLEEVVRVIDDWGEASGTCAPCSARPTCCRVSPTYLARFGAAELRVLDAEAFGALRERARAFRLRIEKGLVATAAPRPGEAGGMRAAFEQLDRAAREENWQEVRNRAMAILESVPDEPAAMRMRRMAEVHLLDEIATRLERHGEVARARRTRRLIALHYGDIVGTSQAE